MSFAAIRPYFNARMLAVDPDFREWEDAFNVDNIPSTMFDKAWHLEFSPSTFGQANQACLTFLVPVSLKVFLKGYRSPKDAVDKALSLAESIVKEASGPSNRLNQPLIKNVLPNLVDVRKLSETNDNSVVLEISFNCLIIIGF